MYVHQIKFQGSKNLGIFICTGTGWGGVLTWGVKWPGPEPNHSLPSSDKMKNT